MKPTLYIRKEVDAQQAIKATINLLLTLASENYGKEEVNKVLLRDPNSAKLFKWSDDK